MIVNPVLGLGQGVDFTFAWENNSNNNPHLNFLRGALLWVKSQGEGVRDMEYGEKWSLTLNTKL